MQELKERILADGVVIGDQVLKVDSFLNHQIDPAFILRMGQELAARYADSGITKILTVEASGIAVAMGAGLALGVPVLFAKKKQAITQDADAFSAKIYSFTRRESVSIVVSAKFLTPADTVLIVDDFLAHGEALTGLISIVQKAGAKLAGAGIVIEKRFQRGGEMLRSNGVRIESLAVIDSMADGHILFG